MSEFEGKGIPGLKRLDDIQRAIRQYKALVENGNSFVDEHADYGHFRISDELPSGKFERGQRWSRLKWRGVRVEEFDWGPEVIKQEVIPCSMVPFKLQPKARLAKSMRNYQRRLVLCSE